MADWGIEEIGGMILAVSFIAIIGTAMTSFFNPNIKQSELLTSETAAIISLIPKESQVNIKIEEDVSIKELENNNFVIAVNDEYNEQKSKEKSDLVKVEIKNQTLIITS